MVLVGCGTSVQNATAQGATGPAGSPGLVFLGAYGPATQYVATDVVTYQGSSYVALSTNTNVAPLGATASATDWAVLAQAGATGATGAQGPAGATGPQGPLGPQGFTGTPGPAGPQGAPGLTGATGATGITGATGPQGVAGANALSSWHGKTLCAISDSLFSAPSPNIPQQEASSLGMTLGSIDLVPGRTMQQLFADYNGSSPNSVYTGALLAANGGISNIAIGTSLTGTLASCDVLQIEDFGNNNDSGAVAAGYPYGPYWGNYADADTASTLAGHMRLNAEILHSLNPTMKVIWVAPYTMPPATGYYANLNPAMQAQLAQLIANDFGDPVISLVPSGMSPPRSGSALDSAGNYVNASGASLYGLGNNNVHPSNLGASYLLVPYLVRQMNLLGPN